MDFIKKTVLLNRTVIIDDLFPENYLFLDLFFIAFFF